MESWHGICYIYVQPKFIEVERENVFPMLNKQKN